MNDPNQMINRPKKRWRIQLSNLLLVVTIFAILAAWLVDHRKLHAQIEPPERKTVFVYHLANASPDRVIEELSRLYPTQQFIPGAKAKPSGMTKSEQDKTVTAATDVSLREQVGILIEHFDRTGTDLTDDPKVADDFQLNADPALRQHVSRLRNPK